MAQDCEDKQRLSLAQRLRSETRVLHAEAERSGVMRSLLKGDLSLASYCLLLRNLLEIYSALEPALVEHAKHPLIAPICTAKLFRCAALELDLEVLHGNDWATSLAVAKTARTYADRLIAGAAREPRRLLAHAYVRFLGDLSGGQILLGIVRKSMKLRDDAGTRFYQFDAPHAQTLAMQFRCGLDAIAVDDETAGVVVDEARWAFSMHARLFEELH